MSFVAWPGTIPYSCDIDQLQETDLDGLIRFKPSYGLEKLRQRTTMVLATLVYQKTMTTAQWDLLQTFYRLTTLNGSQPFTTNHPRTGAAITAQFSAPPSTQSIQSTGLITVTIQLTVLPVNAS